MAEKLIVSGARGASLTELARVTGNFGVQPTDSDAQALTKFADAAIQQNPGFKGDTGNTGPANSTYTSLASLKAAAVTNASYIFAPPSGSDGGAAAGTFLYQTAGAPYTADGVNVVKLDSVPLSTGALVRQGADGIAYRSPLGKTRSAEAKSSDIVSVNDEGAAAEGGGDNTQAFQDTILKVAQRGGGEIIVGAESAGYFIGGQVYIPSNIRLNLNGQTLRGVAGQSLFKTGRLNGNVIDPIVGFDPFNVVENSSVMNGKIQTAGIAFDLQSWTKNCTVNRIRFEGVRQGAVMRQCFYSSWLDLYSDAPGTDFAYPFMHLVVANNAMVFQNCKLVVSNGWLVEGGTAALRFDGCSYEGGGLGLKVKNDVDGLQWIGGYIENVPGTMFDFSEAGACWLDIDVGHYNGVETIFDDGGATGTCTLFGRFGAAQHAFNGPGLNYSLAMKISGPRNYMTFPAQSNAQTSLLYPSTYTLSKQTRGTGVATWNADGTANGVRAVAEYSAGIQARAYSGDVGTPFQGSIPFSTITLPQGASVTATVQTQITLENNASVVHFLIAIADNTGAKKVSGTIYGDFVDQRQGQDRPVTVSQTADGKLILSIGGINNTNGAVFLTGTVYLGR